MKFQIITDQKGEVIATGKMELEALAGAPKYARILPSAGQKEHELEVPEAIHALKLKDVAEFHRALEKHLKSVKG